MTVGAGDGVLGGVRVIIVVVVRYDKLGRGSIFTYTV